MLQQQVLQLLPIIFITLSIFLNPLVYHIASSQQDRPKILQQ